MGYFRRLNDSHDLSVFDEHDVVGVLCDEPDHCRVLKQNCCNHEFMIPKKIRKMKFKDSPGTSYNRSSSLWDSSFITGSVIGGPGGGGSEIESGLKPGILCKFL